MDDQPGLGLSKMINYSFDLNNYKNFNIKKDKISFNKH